METPRESNREVDPTENPIDRSSTASRRRLLLVVAFLAGLYLLGERSGWINQVSAESVRETIRAAGPWGAALYVVLFSLGELIHIPGILFVGAGILAYGKFQGFALAMVAAIGSALGLTGPLLAVTFLFERLFP